MGDKGREHSQQTSGKEGLSGTRGTESGTLKDDSALIRQPADPDLQFIIDAWSTLPVDVRKMIVGVVKLTPRAPATGDTAT